MKKTFTILAVILYFITTNYSFAQTYNGAFYEMFFGRQPSAKAEAMGRSIASIPGDAISYYYNPAGMASLKGLNLNGSFASPYYSLDTARYNFFGASYNIKKYGTVGLSRDYFNYGYEDEIIVTDEIGNVTGTYTYDPDITNYRMTLSSEVIKDLFVGVNLNFLHPDLIPDEYNLTVGNEKFQDENVFYFDLGVIKAFNIKSNKLNHNINLGTSLINVNSADYSPIDEDQGDKLPVIFRLGASYDLSLDDRSISSKLKSYNFLVNAEYEDLFNSKYYGGFHSGFEFTFLEILSLRAGFYTQDNMNNDASFDDSGNVTINKIENTLNEFTYGFGVNIPIRQLTNGKTPIELKFDYANLKQPPYINDEDSPGNYHVYTIIFNWIF